MDDHIIPECFIDTKLVSMLVPPVRGEYNHQWGNGTVATKMQKYFADDFAVGIIDNDKKTLAYADECTLLIDADIDLQLLKHPNFHHYFIVHTPSERWIIDLIKQAGLTMAAFGLSEDPKALKDTIKTSKSNRTDPQTMEKFNRLFRELKRAQLSPILTLTCWLTHLRDNPYAPDLDWLRLETDRIFSKPNDPM